MKKKLANRLILAVILTSLLLGMVTSPTPAATVDPPLPGLIPPQKNKSFNVWNCYPGAPVAWWLQDCRDWGWQFWDRYFYWNEDLGKKVPSYLLEYPK
jgi:hypothetical protein